MNHDRLARMYEAARLTRQGRLVEASAVLQPGSGGGGPLPRIGIGMPAWSSRLPHGSAPRPASATKPRPAPVLPGLFLDVAHTNAAGERRCKLYVPSGYTGQAVPLIVMLHGGTQSADDFAAGTRMNELAERHRFLVAYPEQSRSANPMGYWNWFQPKDQRRGGGEASLIAGLTTQIIDAYAVDTRRVYVAGFSAGGAMAAVMASAYPDVYAAAGVHSGLAAGAAHDVSSAFTAMAQGAPTDVGLPVPLIVFHGDGDATVDHVNADCLVRAVLPDARDRQRPVTTNGRVAGGHAYSRRVYADRDGTPRVEHWTIHGAGHAWSVGARTARTQTREGPTPRRSSPASSPSTPTFTPGNGPPDPVVAHDREPRATATASSTTATIASGTPARRRTQRRS